MHRLIVVFYLSLLIMASCNNGDNNTSGYTLHLDITGVEDSTAFRLLDLDKGEFIDSTYIINGKLKFSGEASEPFVARIHTIDNKYLIIWIENKDITVSGDIEDFALSDISGSPLNEIMVKYRDKQKTLQMQRSNVMSEMIALMSSPEEGSNEKLQKLSKEVNKIDEDVFRIRAQSIKLEEPSLYTLKELYFLRNDLAKDSLNLLFNKFPEALKNSKYGNVITSYLDASPVTIGDAYMDIEGVNQEGKLIKLSSLEGKLILLDFWASWCGPCRNENPNLVSNYKKYGDKGFDIYSFSIDNNKSSWNQAVLKDSLTWTNVIDEDGSYSTMSAKYGVSAIPANFLINKEGTIIAKDLRGEQLNEILTKELN